MGMDVIGVAPKTEAGEYFRNNIWWWHPLAAYVCDIAPDVTSHCEGWHWNDGEGLDETHSLELARKIRKDIDSGRASVYEQAHRNRAERLPKEQQYPFSLENVREFAEFLENCGGFAIW